MPSSTASTQAGIVAVHRHQGFGSPSAYAISQCPLGSRHGSGCTFLAPLKMASNERPASMLTRSGSVSRSSPPPRASSARSCARQSTSIVTPVKQTLSHEAPSLQSLSIRKYAETRSAVVSVLIARCGPRHCRPSAMRVHAELAGPWYKASCELLANN